MIAENDFSIKFRSIAQILAEYPLLKEAFRYVLAANTSYMAPYHNTWHIMCVVKYTDWLLRSEKNSGLYEQEDELDELALLLAALFHDVNHTAGKESDDVNVQNSKYAFNDFISVIDSEDIREEWLKARVHKLIDATQFPYVIPKFELSHDQKIIRDADLMQVYESDMFYCIIIGMGREFKKLPLPMLKSTIDFHTQLVVNTASCEAYRYRALPILISEMERHIRLLE